MQRQFEIEEQTWPTHRWEQYIIVQRNDIIKRVEWKKYARMKYIPLVRKLCEDYVLQKGRSWKISSLKSYWNVNLWCDQSVKEIMAPTKTLAFISTMWKVAKLHRERENVVKRAQKTRAGRHQERKREEMLAKDTRRNQNLERDGAKWKYTAKSNKNRAKQANRRIEMEGLRNTETETESVKLSVK